MSRFYIRVSDGKVYDRYREVDGVNREVNSEVLCAYLNELESRLNDLEAFVRNEETTRQEWSERE